jgi:hypothetical protein
LASSEIARRVLARDPPTVGDGTPEPAGPVLQRSWMRVTDTLRDSMGEAGCAALLERALTHTEAAHPVLKDLRRYDTGDVRLDGIAGSVDAHGIEAVTAAAEALLAAVLDILTRLIGEDMAIRLIVHDGVQSPKRGEPRAP